MLKQRAKIGQITLAISSNEDVNLLIKKLKEAGYVALFGLDDVYKIKEKIIGIVVDNSKKLVFPTNVTCMACWCSSYGSRPLFVNKALDNFAKLFIEQDEDFYNELINNWRFTDKIVQNYV